MEKKKRRGRGSGGQEEVGVYVKGKKKKNIGAEEKFSFAGPTTAAGSRGKGVR